MDNRQQLIPDNLTEKKCSVDRILQNSLNSFVELVVTTVIHVFADAFEEMPDNRRILVFDQ